MDVNAVQNPKGSSSGVASPVVSPPANLSPEQKRVAEKIQHDVAEFTKGGQARAAVDALAANLSRNIPSGSKASYDTTTDQFVVQVVNANNEVIRQLPPEEALRIAARFEQITGLLFDSVI